MFCAFHGTLKFFIIVLDQGLALLTLSWDKNWDSHSLVNGYPSFYPRIALVAPSPGRWLISGNVRKSHAPWRGSLIEMATLSQCSYFLISAGRGCCRSLNVLLRAIMRISYGGSLSGASSYRLQFDGILPKGPYLPCVSMAGRVLLAGYPRIGTRLSDLACRERLCQRSLLCVSMHLVSQPTRMPMHLVLKIYSSSFSRFQVIITLKWNWFSNVT